MTEDKYRQGMRTAMRLLGGRDYTVNELKNRLLQRNFVPGTVADVIAECRRCGYLDDESFAGRFISTQKRKGYGRYRIRIAMQKKGFAPDLIERLLDEQADDNGEMETIRDLIAKHRRTSKPSADKIKEKQRLIRFLRNRGYPDELIRKTVMEDE